MPITERSLDRVLVVHNTYQQRGGEDAVVEAETALLRARGHVVTEYRRHNDELQNMRNLDAALATLWSRQTSQDLDRVLAQSRPDVIHVHNTFPLISPSIHWAAAAHRVPLVQTLHNFRPLCLNALLLRDGEVCEDCIGRIPWRGVVRACYRDSRAASGVVAGMLMLHRGLGTFPYKVARYIALNDFCRNKFIAGGLPAQRILVKPNFVDLVEVPVNQRRSGFLYVGRLAVEKGITTLTEATKACGRDIDVRVAGVGPEEGVLMGVATITRLGLLARSAVRAEMERAMALVVPSVCHETFGLVAIEAFAAGMPVIASRLGALADLIRDGVTGLLFKAGDAADLAAKLRWAQAHPEQMQQMGLNARAEYEAKYTAEINYRQLTAIYDEARHACAAD